MGSDTQRTVKVGVAGCGVVATAYYLPYLAKMETADITAVCDLNPVRTEACVRLFGAKEQYTDYYDMLEKSDLDAVFILTAPGQRNSGASRTFATEPHEGQENRHAYRR